MGDKYQNKYRIASTRLQNWDYGWNAAYFITSARKTGNVIWGISLKHAETQQHTETQNFVSLQRQPPQNRFGPQSQNIGSVIRGYKTGVKKHAICQHRRKSVIKLPV